MSSLADHSSAETPIVVDSNAPSSVSSEAGMGQLDMHHTSVDVDESAPGMTSHHSSANHVTESGFLVQLVHESLPPAQPFVFHPITQQPTSESSQSMPSAPAASESVFVFQPKPTNQTSSKVLSSDQLSSQATTQLISTHIKQDNTFQHLFIDAHRLRFLQQSDDAFPRVFHQQSIYPQMSIQLDGSGTDEFVQRLQRFWRAQFEFEHHAFTTQRTSAQLDSLALSPMLWKKSMKTVHVSGRCGCHHPVAHDYSFEIIEFDQSRANSLQQQMVSQADAKLNVYSFKQYQLVLAKTEIDLPLFQFLQRLDDIIRSEGTAGESDLGPLTIAALTQLRSFINSLFAVQREIETCLLTTGKYTDATTQSENDDQIASSSSQSSDLQPNFKACAAIQSAVRHWLMILVDCLFRVGSLDDHEFILRHCVRTRGISQWSHFVQFPSILQSIPGLLSEHQAGVATQAAPLLDWQSLQSASNLSDAKASDDLAADDVLNKWMPRHAFDSSIPFEHIHRQCRDAWTNALSRHFLSMFSILMSPLEFSEGESTSKLSSSSSTQFLVGIPTIFDRSTFKVHLLTPDSRIIWDQATSIPVESLFGSDHDHTQNQHAMASTKSGDEWELLEKPLPDLLNHGDTSPRLCLNESDFTSLFQSFPIQSFVDALFMQAFAVEFEGSLDNQLDHLKSNISHAFATCKVVSSFLCNILLQISEYPQFAKLVAQSICYLTWSPIIIWRKFQPLLALQHHHRQFSNHVDIQIRFKEISMLLQRELDWLCMRSVTVLQHHSAVTFFLADFPFSLLSKEAVGQIFLSLIFSRPVSHFRDSSSQLHLLELQNWNSLMQADRNRHQLFAKQFQNSNSVHLLYALDKVARHGGGSLPQIWCSELFSLAFVQEATRQVLIKTCLPLFASVCSMDRVCISVLLRETCSHFSHFDRLTVLNLFGNIDLQHWLPTAEDLLHIKLLLMHDGASARAELGRYLLESLNFGYELAADQNSESNIHSSRPSRKPTAASVELSDNDSAAAPSSIHSDLFVPGSEIVPAASSSSAPSSHVQLCLPAQLHLAILTLLAEVRLAHLLSSSRASMYSGLINKQSIHELMNIQSANQIPTDAVPSTSTITTFLASLPSLNRIFQQPSPQWWTETLLLVQLRSAVRYSSFVYYSSGISNSVLSQEGEIYCPIEQSMCSELRSKLLSGELAQSWISEFHRISQMNHLDPQSPASFDNEETPTGDFVGATAAFVTSAVSSAMNSISQAFPESKGESISDNFPYVLVSALLSVRQQPLTPNETDSLFADPVLVYCDAQTDVQFATCALRSELTPLKISWPGWDNTLSSFEDSSFRPLQMRLLSEFLPAVLKINPVSDQIEQDSSINYLVRSILDNQKPVGLLSSIFTSKFVDVPDIIALLPVINTQLMFASVQARDHSVSVASVIQFWLHQILQSESTNIGNAASKVKHLWHSIHSAKCLADSLVQMTFLLKISHLNVNSMQSIETFLSEQNQSYSDTVQARTELQQVILQGYDGHIDEAFFKTSPRLLEPYDFSESTAHYGWLTLLDLILQIRQNWFNFVCLGRELVKFPLTISCKEIFKRRALSKDLFWNTLIRRVVGVVLTVPVEHDLLPLYWQLFFVLYFAKVPALIGTKNTIFGAGNETGIFGYRLLEGNSGSKIMESVVKRLSQITDHLTLLRQNGNASDSSVNSQRPALFTAMSVWLSKDIQPSKLQFNLHRLPSLYCAAKLATVFVTEDDLQDLRFLWWDCVDTTELWLYQVLPTCVPYFGSLPLVFSSCFLGLSEDSNSSNSSVDQRWNTVFRRNGTSLHAGVAAVTASQTSTSSNSTSTSSYFRIPFISSVISTTVRPLSTLELRLMRRLTWSTHTSFELLSGLIVQATERTQRALTLGSTASEWAMREAPAALKWTPSPSPAENRFLELVPFLQSNITSALQVSSMQQLLTEFTDSLRLFVEKQSTSCALDMELFEHISHVHRNENLEPQIIQQPCQLRGRRCLKPAELTLNTSQIITVQSAIAAANQNRQFIHHVLRAAVEVSARLSVFALQINRITLWLLHFGGGPLNPSHTMSPLNRDWQDSEANVENQLLATRFGLHWFYSLLELDRNELRAFAPIHMLFKSLLPPLAQCFVPRNDFLAQEKFMLTVVGHHSKEAHLTMLSELFRSAFVPFFVPAQSSLSVLADPGSNAVIPSQSSTAIINNFMPLFRVAMRSVYGNPSLQPRHLHAIFSRFNTSGWLSTNQSAAECEEIVSFCVGALQSEYALHVENRLPEQLQPLLSGDSKSERSDWWNWLQLTIVSVVSHRLSEMHMRLLDSLLLHYVSSAHTITPPFVFSACLARLPWSTLSFEELILIVQKLKFTLTNWRMHAFVNAANGAKASKAASKGSNHLPTVQNTSLSALLFRRDRGAAHSFFSFLTVLLSASMTASLAPGVPHDVADLVWRNAMGVFVPFVQHFVSVSQGLATKLTPWLQYHSLQASIFTDPTLLAPHNLWQPNADSAFDSMPMLIMSVGVPCPAFGSKDEAEVVIHYLIRSIQLISKLAITRQDALSKIWSFYATHLLPYADNIALNIVHLQLLSIDSSASTSKDSISVGWSDWQIDSDILNSLNSIISAVLSIPTPSNHNSNNLSNVLKPPLWWLRRHSQSTSLEIRSIVEFVSQVLSRAEFNFAVQASVPPLSTESLLTHGYYSSMFEHDALSRFVNTYCGSSITLGKSDKLSLSIFLDESMQTNIPQIAHLVGADGAHVRASFWNDFLFQASSSSANGDLLESLISVIAKLISVSEIPLAEHWLQPNATPLPLLLNCLIRAWPESSVDQFQRILSFVMEHLIVSDVCSVVENMTLREPAALGRIQNRRFVLLSWLIRMTLSLPLSIGEERVVLPYPPAAVASFVDLSIAKISSMHQCLLQHFSKLCSLLSPALCVDLFDSLYLQLVEVLQIQQTYSTLISESACRVLNDCCLFLNDDVDFKQMSKAEAETRQLLSNSIHTLSCTMLKCPTPSLLCRTSTALILAAIRAACQNLLSVKPISDLCHAAFQKVLEVSHQNHACQSSSQQVDRSGAVVVSVQAILRFYTCPELNFNEFISHCMSEGRTLVLFCTAVSRIQTCADSLGPFLDSSTPSLQRKLLLQSYQKECESWLDRSRWSLFKLNTELTVAQSVCHEMQLFSLWIYAAAHMIRCIRHGGNVQTATQTISQFVRDVLSTFGADKQSSGLFGMLGFGAKSTYGVQFRLLCRVLATSIQLLTDTNGNIVFDEQNIGVRSEKTSDIRLKLLSEFELTNQNTTHEYPAYRGVVATLSEELRAMRQPARPLWEALTHIVDASQRLLMIANESNAHMEWIADFAPAALHLSTI